MMSKPKKAVKVSKNRKKTWRKHCPIDDVEEYLENNRFNERIGGAIADKSDDSLFVVEKTANAELLNEDQPKTRAAKESKLKSIQSDLKYFKLLESQSKAEPIVPRVGPKDKRRTFLNDDKKFAKLWPQKQLQYLRAKQKTDEKKAVKLDPKLRFNFSSDLWADAKETDPKDDEIEELIDYQEVLKGSKPPKVPKHRYQKPSLLPSVEPPLSGQSYNPSFEDHQNLLAIAHDIEVKKIREDNHLKRVVEDHYVSRASAPNDQTWAKEMSHGLGLSDDEEDNESEDQMEENEDKTWNQLIRADKKKTRAQRRKELLQKETEKKKRLEKSLKSSANEIFKLKTYKKELNQKEKESSERQKRRSARNLAKLFQPKRMSRYKYEEPDVELHLTHELSGCLRSMKTEGNLLQDRFKSIQRRNIIETRTKQTFKRKYKLKKIIKKSCKDPIV